jgi:hypothetical protein
MCARIDRSAAKFLCSMVFGLAAAMPSGAATAGDRITAEREAARSWGMHRIAVIQAADGDSQNAKHTLSQIGEMEPKNPAPVTIVSFCNGLPVYRSTDDVATTIETSPGWGGFDSFGTQYFLAADRPASQVPARVPEGLSQDYLQDDPKHGPLVDFTDERDSRGTRVTLREYADGYLVIETPR